MWQKSSNSDNVKPLEVSIDVSGVIVRKNFELIEATEENPEHWEYLEWQMTHDQYEIWLAQQAELDAQSLVNDQARADIDYLLMITEEE